MILELRKGFLIALFIGIGFSLMPVLAAQKAPVWEDFCPKGLEDAEYKEIQWFWPEGTKSTQSIYNYWALRRKEFEKGLAECEQIQGGVNNSCYENLKERQLFVNEQYNKDIKQKQITNQIWLDDHDKGSRPIMINIFMK